MELLITMPLALHPEYVLVIYLLLGYNSIEKGL